MRETAVLQAKPAHKLSRDEWMVLAMSGKLTPAHLQWRSELASLEHSLSDPHALMLQAVEEGHSPGAVLLGTLLTLQDLKAPRLTQPAQSPTNILKVSKFNPGKHFHVLDTKFDTMDAAIAHLKQKGYIYGGLEEHYWPTVNGD